ncbi:uncharacterized protein KZ484_004886 isoform 2-T4 [Pholidichthys leucotaenia]
MWISAQKKTFKFKIQGDSPNIKAEPGQTVVLPCRAPVNNTDIAVEYSRADLEPESVFLHRDKQDIHEGQHKSFKNRVELLDEQMKNGDVSLVLNNVTFSDSGVYECHVLYNEGEKTKELITTITLTVGKREDEEKKGEGNQQNSATVPIWVTVLLVFLVLGGAVIGGVLWYCRSNTNKVPQVVEVDSGVESVLLPWRTNVPLTDDVTVEWTDEFSRKVHVYQNSSDDPEEQDRRYRGRTEMKKDLKTGDVSLTLKSPTWDDSGRFLRTISSNHGNALMKKEVKLKVRVSQVVEVDSGVESVLLPWRTNIPLTDDVTVKWTDKRDKKVHVYQNGSDHREEQDRRYRGRTARNKDLKTGDVSLTLKYPTWDDSGRFLCTIYSNHGNILRRKEVGLKVRGTVQVQGPTEDIRTSSSSPDPTPLLPDSPVSSVGGSVPVRKNQE